MSKNCIIIHGCADQGDHTYNTHWIPWLKRQLETNGVPTDIPLMPEPWAPDYAAYKQVLDQLPVTEETVLVGHSCGCAFLVRWLGETKKRVAKLILVAPWKIPDPGDEVKEAFYVYPINETLKDRVGATVLFTSDDEAPEGKESLKLFHDAVGGEIVELAGYGHYTLVDMGTEEFSELLRAVLS